jgi:hypothetical protein
MQAICDEEQLTRRAIYRVAGQSIVVEAQDHWAAKVIEELFAGWYLSPDTNSIATLKAELPAPAIVIRSSVSPPQMPRDWDQFEIAGGGHCCTDGQVSYIDIEGSIVVITELAAVEVWTNGPLEIQSPVFTRVVT